MRNNSSFRVICTICFIFAILCTVPYFKPYTGVFAIAVATWGVICILFSRVKSAAVRVAASLIGCVAAAAVLFPKISKFPLAAIVTSLIGVYFTVFMGLGRFDKEYWRFRRSFIGMISVSAFTSAIYIFVYIAVKASTKNTMNLEGVIGFTIACALCGFFSLSEMRKGDTDSKWSAMNAGRILSIFGLMVAALVVVYLFLAFGIARINPIIGRVALEKPEFKGEEIHAPAYSMAMQTPNGDKAYKDKTEEDQKEGVIVKDEKSSLPWWYIATGVLVVASVAAVFIVRAAKKKKRIQAMAEGGEGSLDPEIADNVMKIRTAYRQYINHVKKEGAALSRGSTSEDILESSEEIAEMDDEREKELREIYIKARYGNPESVTAEDAARAQELLAQILS